MQRAYPKTIKIEPSFDLKNETEFEKIIYGSMPYPAFAGYYEDKFILPSLASFGLKYELPAMININNPLYVADESQNDIMNMIEKQHHIPTGLQQISEKMSTTRSENVLQESSAPDAIEHNDNIISDKSLNPNETLPNAISSAIAASAKEDTGKWWFHVWIWICVPAQEDNRPKWLKLYENGHIKYNYTYSESDDGVTHFRVKAYFRYLEVLCTDCRISEMTFYAQRIDKMSIYNVDYYVHLAFNSICEWYPAFNRGIDYTKFMKFIREAKIFPDLKEPARSSQIELLFIEEAKSENGFAEKFVTLIGFYNLIQDIALIRFPPSSKSMNADDASKAGTDDNKSITDYSMISKLTTMPKELPGLSPKTTNTDSKAKLPTPAKVINRQSLQNRRPKNKEKSRRVKKEAPPIDPEYAIIAFDKFVNEFIMTYPAWCEIPWEESKLTVMKIEAKKYCAVTRIIAVFRGSYQRKRYLFFLRTFIILQAHVRRKITIARTKVIIRILVEDWVFRQRYHMATKINACARRFITRCSFFRIMAKIKEQDLIMMKARRYKLRKIHQQKAHGVIYQELKRINGYMCILKMRRADERNYSSDYSMVFEVYLPKYQKTAKFILPEKDLREYMCQELQLEALSLGDLTDKRNLQALISARLVVRQSKRPIDLPRVFFSKQSLGQRGAKVLTKGMKNFF
jgi:hypothetical protein